MRNGLLVTGYKFLHHPAVLESPFMTRHNAPLTPSGRLRMVHRHLHYGIPKAHVAAEFRAPARPWQPGWPATLNKERPGWRIAPQVRGAATTAPLQWSLSSSRFFDGDASGRPGAFTATCGPGARITPARRGTVAGPAWDFPPARPHPGRGEFTPPTAADSCSVAGAHGPPRREQAR